MRLKTAVFCAIGSNCPLALSVPLGEPGAKLKAKVKISPRNAPPAPPSRGGKMPLITKAWVSVSDAWVLSMGVCGMVESPTLQNADALRMQRKDGPEM